LSPPDKDVKHYKMNSTTGGHEVLPYEHNEFSLPAKQLRTPKALDKLDYYTIVLL